MIYLDWSATTPLCDAAKKAIIEHLDCFGNPSSSYELGRQSRLLIESARERIAKCINAEPEEIYFTSGGSEANTWAFNKRTGLSSNIEHHSNQHFGWFEVNNTGVLNKNRIDNLIESICYLQPYQEVMSCMYVNNEIGIIQPIKDFTTLAHKYNKNVHTDAVQAIGHIPVDVKELGVDMLSASGHKFGAQKGIGFLFAKNGTKIHKLIYGGKQESALRGGTENILGIISMAAALEDAIEHMEERNNHIKRLRDKMLDHLLTIEGAHLNGSLENRVVSNINIRFDNVPGARLVALCDLYGICISSGSACNEGVPTPSHVLKAIGLSDTEALSSVRITIGYKNTEQEIDEATEIITKLVERIRCDK